MELSRRMAFAGCVVFASMMLMDGQRGRLIRVRCCRLGRLRWRWACLM